MKKAWSFFWLVVAACIAFTILVEVIKPYLWLIAALILIAVSAFVVTKIRQFIRSRRTHY